MGIQGDICMEAVIGPCIDGETGDARWSTLANGAKPLKDARDLLKICIPSNKKIPETGSGIVYSDAFSLV